MSFEIERSQNAITKPWGKANPRRGANYEDRAREFVAAHPIGTTITAQEFDEWAWDNGYLPRLSADADKQSDAWKAHLQRRHELRTGLVRAGAHPRMDTPFTIEHVAGGVYEICSPQVAISQTKMLARIESLTDRKRTQLRYLMQSADWSVLPAHERAFAEALFDDIEMFKDSLDLSIRSLDRKFDKLAHRLRKAVESGEIRPRNGGIKQIVDQTADH